MRTLNGFFGGVFAFQRVMWYAETGKNLNNIFEV